MSALAILFAAPAQALLDAGGGGSGSLPASTIGNPGDSASASQAASVSELVGIPDDSASVAPVRSGQPTVTSGATDGFDTTMLVGIAGGVVLALGAGALLFTIRHRRVALP